MHTVQGNSMVTSSKPGFSLSAWGAQIRRHTLRAGLAAVTLAGLSLGACAATEAPSDAVSITPREVVVDRKTDTGPALQNPQSWSTINPHQYGCIVPVGVGADGVPKGILRLDIYTTGKAPNGGLIREAMIERYSPTGAQPEYAVTHDLRNLCANDDKCTTTEMYFECFGATPMADEGMAAVLMLMPWSSNDPYFGYYLVRFGPDGKIVFSHRVTSRSAALAELKDGTLVHLDREEDDTALLVKRLDKTGKLLSTTRIEDVQLADSGDNIPGVEHPSILKIVPLRDGGFEVVGKWVTTRDIQCYTTDAPKPPSTSTCAQETYHALVGRFSALGEKVSMRHLGRGFREPASEFTGAVELENGIVVATGVVDGATALAHMDTSGNSESVTKLCPCGTPSTSWTPGALTPIAAGNDVDFIELSSNVQTVTTALAMRLTAAGEISATRRLRNSAGKPAEVSQLPMLAGNSWLVFDYEATLPHLRMWKLTGQ